MTEDRKQLDRRWLWLGAVIVLIAVFFVVRALIRDRMPVHAVVVARAPLNSTISTNGRVEPEVNYEIHSPVSAIVKAVYVQPGDVVPAGKVLLELDDLQARAHVASSESGVKAAEAAVESATLNGTLQERQMGAADLSRARLERDESRRGLDALTKLNATGAASSNEVAGARQRLANAEASLHALEESSHTRYSPAEIERARAALAEAKAGLAAARQVLAETVVRAPIAGTVYTLNVGRTEFAEAGALLLQIADLSHERVRAYFDEPEIGKLAAGQAILIKWDAKPTRLWHGHIDRIPISIMTYGTRNVGSVLVKVDDVDSELLPNTNVTVTVTTSTEEKALAVPREALHMDQGKPFVYKVVNGELHKTPVTTGTINLTQVAVLSGLQEGDIVATGAVNGLPLQEGIPAKVVR